MYNYLFTLMYFCSVFLRCCSLCKRASGR